MHDDDVGLQWRHVTTNDSGWRWWWLLSGSKCSRKLLNVNRDLPTEAYLFCQLMILIWMTCNFNNVPVTKHGAQTSSAQRPQINTGLYATYWSRGMAEYDRWKVDVLRIHIRLLPVTTSTDPHIRTSTFYHHPSLLRLIYNKNQPFLYNNQRLYYALVPVLSLAK